MSQENENTSLQQTQEAAVGASKSKRCYFWFKLLMVLGFGVGILFYNLGMEALNIIIECAAFGLIPFLIILSFIGTGLKGGRASGVIIRLFLLAIYCFFINGIAYYKVPRAEQGRPYYATICRYNLKNLGTALRTYADDHEGILPAADWCDRLIEGGDIEPDSFRCLRLRNIEGESAYCLNQYAAGKKLSELSSDMVLLFEIEVNYAENEERLPIKQRPSFAEPSAVHEKYFFREKVYLNQWNQVGGPELLDVSRHYQGSLVLFADGQSKMIPLTELSTLRWDIEGKVRYDKPFPASVMNGITIATNKKITLGILGLLVSAVAVYILSKFHFVLSWKFAVILGILAAGAGFGFGNYSGEAYLYHRSVGGLAGVATGFLAGICFAVIFAGRSNGLKQSVTFKWFMMGVGMITGILCSTFVHIALMIVNEETNPFGIIIGIPYGIFVGGVLGLISYFIIRKFYTREQGTLKL